MKIALTDMDIVWENREANKEICKKMTEEASQKGADLILFPEMTLTGFSMNTEKICDKDGETIAFFSRLATENRIAAGFGYAAWGENQKAGNHFCIVGSGGEVISDYVKIHPFTHGGENEYFDGGEHLVSFMLEGMRCSSFVCYDLRFAEAFAKLPEDTDAVFVIANWPSERIFHWHTLLCARALETQCFVAGVNRIGSGGGVTYQKSSAAYGPDGMVLQEEKGKWNRYVVFDNEKRKEYVKGFPVRKDRRPLVYDRPVWFE